MNGRRFVLAVAKSYLVLMALLVLFAALWSRMAHAAEAATRSGLAAGWQPMPLSWAAIAVVLLALLAAVANWRRLATAKSRLETSLGALQRAQGEIRGLAEFVSENPSPVLRIDRDGRVLYANLAALELIPIDADSLPMDAEAKAVLRDAGAGRTGEVVQLAQGERSWSFIAIREPESGIVDLFGREVTRERAASAACRESEERMRLAVDSLGAGIWDWDLNTGHVYRSARLLALFGLPMDFAPTQKAWADRIHPDDRTRADQARAALASGAADRMDVTYRFWAADGAYRWVSTRARLMRGTDGEPARAVGLVADVTEQKESEARQRLQAAALEAAGTAVIVTDNEGAIEWINPAYARMSGYSLDELRGRKPAIFEKLFGRDDDAGLRELLASGRAWQSEHSDRRRDGRTYQVRQMVTPITGESGEVTHFVATLDEVTAQREAEQQVRRLAHFDELTGLPNRTLFRDRLAHAITQADRWERTFALLLLDLDHFKDINDTLGHHVGDALLKHVGSMLHDCLRTPDTLARLGGDEFAIIIEDLREERDATRLAERILQSFGQPLSVDGHSIDVSPSIGITVYPTDNGTPDDLLRNADLAMYQAKADGRAAFRYYGEDLQSAALERAGLARALRRAIGGEELYLRFQPKLDLATGKLVGAEALLRWRHPEQGEIPPARFIAIAEETGVIGDLGAWVLRRVCAYLAEWRDRGLPRVPVAVNLSGVQLSQSGLAPAVEATLSEYGIGPDLLEVEITETVLMKSTQRAMENLADLDRMGVHISLDDFGTGYSSLAYLSRFPVRRLKVDMTFVQGIGSNRNDEAIVKAVVGLAHNLDIRAVAEGVETESQMEFLREWLCDEVQGFLLSQPLLEADFVAFMQGSEESALSAS